MINVIQSVEHLRVFKNVYLFSLTHEIPTVEPSRLAIFLATSNSWNSVPDYHFSSANRLVAKVRKPGYIYVYISNENPVVQEVYFDNLKIRHIKSPAIQYSEYYPFGLQTACSWTRDNTTNNFLYNGGTELNQSSGVYDLFFRNYDPVLGRMNGVDPLAHKYAGLTPYNYAFNDPVFWNDPMGDDPIERQGDVFIINWNQIGVNGGKWTAPQDASTGGGQYGDFGSVMEAVMTGTADANYSGALTLVTSYQGANYALQIHFSGGSAEYILASAVTGSSQSGYIGNHSIPFTKNPDGTWSVGGSNQTRTEIQAQQTDPDPWRTTKAAAGVAFITSAADGPIPVGEIVGAAIIIGAVAWDLIRPAEQGNPNYPGPWTTTKPDPTIPFYGPRGNSSYGPPDPEGLPPEVGVGVGGAVGALKLLQDYIERRDALKRPTVQQDATKYVIPRLGPR